MATHTMYFIGSDGNVLRFGQLVPMDNELCHSSDGGQSYETLIFTSVWGEYFTSHTKVDYIVWKTEDDRKEGDRTKGEPLTLRDGVVTFRGRTYTIDRSRRAA